MLDTQHPPPSLRRPQLQPLPLEHLLHLLPTLLPLPSIRRRTCIVDEDVGGPRVLPPVCCRKLAHRLEAGQVQLRPHLHLRPRVLLPAQPGGSRAAVTVAGRCGERGQGGCEVRRRRICWE